MFRHNGRILVGLGYDDAKDERFYRPLGGAVEFGEMAVDALRREVREELGLEIRHEVQLGVLENLFEYRGAPGHEVVFVFDASFADPAAYAAATLPIREPGWDGPARWINVADPLDVPIYPTGLLELLR